MVETKNQGIVKWFNTKTGYGFVSTKIDGNPVDVFAHFSGIVTNDEQYKYLVQGEYVEFTNTRCEGGEHVWQASNITGIGGGPLMCETRRQLRLQRTQHNEAKSTESVAEPKSDTDVWTNVNKKTTKKSVSSE